MYFVVYLKTLGKNVVLPAKWIHNIDEYVEKFINNSLNSNQWFLCYYTTNGAAYIDGCPNIDFEPDFQLEIICEVNAQISFDGCFMGKLKKYKGK